MATILHERGGANASPGARLIPYKLLAADLTASEQKFVPFLGAGASLHARPAAEAPASQEFSRNLQEVFESVGLHDEAWRAFVEAAIRIAVNLQDRRAADAEPDPLKAPSAGELAAKLATDVEYNHFEQAARNLRHLAPSHDEAQLANLLRLAAAATGVAPLAPPLLGMASYYQYLRGPTPLWNTLYDRFRTVRETTPIQRLIANIAKRYLDGNPQDPYLCVTTNYDHLLEQAMIDARVPHCVVTVPKNSIYVRTRFSAEASAYLAITAEAFSRMEREQNQMTPDSYFFKPRKPLAIIYKMHGCLDDSERDRNDSVVISDEDYIENIRSSGSNSRLVPNQFRTLMGYRNFLFLGYSFSDWNVRMLYKLLQKLRADQKFESSDYAVMMRADPYDTAFFDDKKINICLTTLDRFSANIVQNCPECASAAAPPELTPQ